jgi:hypothetical protein
MVINHQNQFRENGKIHFPFRDPFVADVFGAGGSVLDSCKGKQGALGFSYESAHFFNRFIYVFF